MTNNDKYDIIYEYDAYPYHYRRLGGVHETCDVAQDEGGAVHEHGSHENQEEEQKHGHYGLHGPAEVMAGEIIYRDSSVFHRNHSGDVVVDRTGEDAAEHNPQIARRAEFGTHDGTEYRAGAGDVQELDHEHFPGGHGHIVQTVVLCDSGCHLGRIGLVQPFHEAPVEDVAQDEGHDADDE